MGETSEIMEEDVQDGLIKWGRMSRLLLLDLMNGMGDQGHDLHSPWTPVL